MNVKKFIRNRDFHKKQAIKHASLAYWKMYKTERNKKVYFRLLSRNTKSTNVNELHINNLIVVVNKQIADAFN